MAARAPRRRGGWPGATSRAQGLALQAHRKQCSSGWHAAGWPRRQAPFPEGGLGRGVTGRGAHHGWVAVFRDATSQSTEAVERDKGRRCEAACYPLSDHVSFYSQSGARDTGPDTENSAVSNPSAHPGL